MGDLFQHSGLQNQAPAFLSPSGLMIIRLQTEQGVDMFLTSVFRHSLEQNSLLSIIGWIIEFLTSNWV